MNQEVLESLSGSGQFFPERLAALLDADDLCTVHAWLALDAMGGEVEARRHPLSSATLGLVEKIRDPAPTGTCRACTLRSQKEAGYCAALAALVSEKSLDRNRPTSSLICLPHLRRTLELVPADTAIALVYQTIGAVQQLRADLAEYIRKHDYRFQAEPKGAEQAAPVRVLAFVAGARSLG